MKLRALSYCLIALLAINSMPYTPGTPGGRESGNPIFQTSGRPGFSGLFFLKSLKSTKNLTREAKTGFFSRLRRDSPGFRNYEKKLLLIFRFAPGKREDILLNHTETFKKEVNRIRNSPGAYPQGQDETTSGKSALLIRDGKIFPFLSWPKQTFWLLKVSLC